MSATITYKSLSVAQPTYLHQLLHQYQPIRSLLWWPEPAGVAYNIIRVWQTCFQLLCTICLEQLTVIYPISRQFQLIQIPSKNPSVCSSLTVTVLLPPSDRPRLRFNHFVWHCARLNHLYVCIHCCVWMWLGSLARGRHTRYKAQRSSSVYVWDQLSLVTCVQTVPSVYQL